MSGKNSITKNVRLNRAANFVLEGLEARQLLSASIVLKPTPDTLLVKGTGHADTITVGRAADTTKIDVSINGVAQQFDLSAVQSVLINGGGGNDTIKIDETFGALPFGVTIYGGKGSDNIVGSSLNDTVIGGAGNDVISGNAGDDSINGNGGVNYLYGNGGNDTLVGGNAIDHIFAGDGDDASYGMGGNDTINSGAGNNLSDGGSGANHIDDATSQGVQAPRTALTPSAVNNTPFGLAPADVRRAYNFGNLADSSYTNRGAGQAIAILTAYHTPTALNDLTRFSVEYGLPIPNAATFQTLYSTGLQPAQDPSVYSYNGWNSEALLDIEWAHAIAPEATILLVEAPSNLNTDLIQAAEFASKYLTQHYNGGVVSMSFGETTELNATDWESALTKKAYRKITYVASSGDEYDVPSSPATSSRVVAVGGTYLVFSNDGNRAGELGWKIKDTDTTTDSTFSGSGGGASSIVPTPNYQQNLQVHGEPIGANRVTPDVAIDAGNGVAVFSSTPFSVDGDTGWYEAAGTSVGAPQWAGLFALANQARREAGRGVIGDQALPNIYALAGSNQGQYFNDITEEQVPPDSTTVPDFKTYVKFDEITGWGSPRASNLITALTSITSSASKTGVVDFAWNGQYRENPSLYPGGNVPLFADYHGNGVATIGAATVDMTFTATSTLNGTNGFTFTVLGIKRSLDGHLSGTGTATQTLPLTGTVTVPGAQTTTSFLIEFDGTIHANGGGGLEIDGTFRGLDPLTNEAPTNGPRFFGSFSS